MLDTPDVSQRLAIMKDRHNALPHLARLGALFSDTVLIEIDGAEFYLHFDRGRLIEVQPGLSRKTPWRFAFRSDGGRT